jgi:hypothetical protein
MPHDKIWLEIVLKGAQEQVSDPVPPLECS